MAYLKAIVLFLPELFKLLNRLAQAIEAGVEEHVIRKKLQAVDKAFDPSTLPADAARALNDVFRGSK